MMFRTISWGATALGGVAFWIVQSATLAIERKAGSRAGVQRNVIPGEVPSAMAGGISRLLAVFILSELIAVCIGLAQAFVGPGFGQGIAIAFVITAIPTAYTLGHYDGAKLPKRGALRAAGLVAGGVACVLVIHVFGRV